MSCSCCVKCLDFFMGIMIVVLYILSTIFSFKYTEYDFEKNKIISETFRIEQLNEISFEGLLSLQNHSNRSTLTLKIFSYILFACVGIILILIAVFCIIGKIKKKEVFITGYKFALPFIIIFASVLLAEVITNVVVLVVTYKIRSYLDIKGHDELTQGYLELLFCTYDNFFYSIWVNSAIPSLLVLAIIKSCIEDENK